MVFEVLVCAVVACFEFDVKQNGCAKDSCLDARVKSLGLLRVDQVSIQGDLEVPGGAGILHLYHFHTAGKYSKEHILSGLGMLAITFRVALVTFSRKHCEGFFRKIS